jgi:hypothetical protein
VLSDSAWSTPQGCASASTGAAGNVVATPGPLYQGVVESGETGAEADGPVGGVSGIGPGN